MNLRYSVISTGNNETKVVPCEVILASGLGTDRLSNKDRSRRERRIQEVRSIQGLQSHKADVTIAGVPEISKLGSYSDYLA